MPYSIMLDAGHGGRDPGAVYNGRQEKEDALRLTMAIGEILQNNGIDVLYTRTTDVYESPYQKAMEANEAGVDFFISIHRNSFPQDNVVSGVESLVFNKQGIKYEMAQNINAQLETIGFINLGVQERPNLVVLRRTKMPAILVEVGFINSDTDNQLFDQNFNDIAFAIASGDDIWSFLASGDYTVTEAAKLQAQEDISENGYWGVEQTSQRILDFAKALSGGDVSKADLLLDAFKKGYEEATGAWGKELPEISKKTYEAVEEKFAAWKNESNNDSTQVTE